jgi:hypothetical protein
MTPLRQDGDLAQVLDHHAQHDVVGNLAEARQLALADIGHAARGKGLDVGLYHVVGGPGARGHGGELAGLHHLGVAAHRCGDQVGAQLGEACAAGGRLLGRDGGTVDEDLRDPAIAAGGDAVRAEADLVHVLAGGNHQEHDVARCQRRRRIHDLGAESGQRLGLGPRPVPHLHRVTGLGEKRRHRLAHAPEPDPAD